MRTSILILGLSLVTVFGTVGCQQNRDQSILDRLRANNLENSFYGTGLNKADIPQPEPECLTISEAQKQLLVSPNVSQADKNRMVNAILVAIKGKSCPGVIGFLNSIYQDDPVADQINLGADLNLDKMRTREIINVVVNNPELPLDATPLWKRAQNIEVKKNKSSNTVLVTGEVVDNRRRVQIEAELDAKDLDEKDATPQKIGELTEGRVITFQEKNGVLSGTTKLPDKKASENPLKVFDDIAGKPASNPTASKEKMHANFTANDLNKIEDCGGKQTLNGLLSVLSGDNSRLVVNGLSVSENDVRSSKKQGQELKALVNRFLEENTKAPASDDGFFVPLKNGKIVYLGQSFSKKHDDFNGAPSVEITAQVHVLKNGEAVKEISGLTSDKKEYVSLKASQSDNTLEKEYSLVLDGNSAYWLQVRSERVLKCLKDRQVAPAEAQPRAVTSAVLFMLLKSKFAYLLN